MDVLELRLAEKRVKDYDIVVESKEAQDCMDCDECLALGVRAYRIIERADRVVAEAICEGLLDEAELAELRNAFKMIYTAWLVPCDKVAQWAKRHEQSGFEMDMLGMFLDCRSRAEDWLERHDHREVVARGKASRFAEEPW